MSAVFGVCLGAVIHWCWNEYLSATIYSGHLCGLSPLTICNDVSHLQKKNICTKQLFFQHSALAFLELACCQGMIPCLILSALLSAPFHTLSRKDESDF